MLSHGTHYTREASSHAYWKHTHRKLNRRLSHATVVIIMTGHEDVTVHCQSIPDRHQEEASLSRRTQQIARRRKDTFFKHTFQIYLKLPSGVHLLKAKSQVLPHLKVSNVLE